MKPEDSGGTIILASGSPRRRELLQAIVDPARTTVRPPANFSEPECPPCETAAEVAAFVEQLAIAKSKAAVAERDPVHATVLAADTLVVADDAGRPRPMGKPPEAPGEYERSVREAFALYSGRSHAVLTGVCVWRAGEIRSTAVMTAVTFHDVTEADADRYAATGEPRGKAGGYAIQGIAAAFVRSIDGSLSNVVGLPVAETRALLEL